MRKILLVSLGGTVGYVLGARAGRPAYDRIMKRWTGFAGTLGFQQLATTAAEAGVDVRDSAVSRFSSAVSTSADSIVERIEPESDAAGSAPRPGSVAEQGTALDPGVRR